MTGRERDHFMNNRLFSGTGTALVTPFRDGSIDFEAFERLIDRQLDAGIDALIVCGTTGEPSTLTMQEREWLIECALRRTKGRVPVIVGTGSNNTGAVVEQSKRAQKAGADALLIVTPYYNKTTQDGLIAHYTAVVDAVDIPIILYNVPSRTGLNMLPATAAELCLHKNICGVKEAGGSIAQVTELARLCGSSAAIYAGNDDQALPVLALGGQGVISAAANVCPGPMKALTQRFFSGDLEGSRQLQLQLTPLFAALFAEVSPIPVKAALDILGLCSDSVRLPLVPATSRCRAALQSLLAGAV